MSVVPAVPIVVAALAVLVVAASVAYHLHRLRRALIAERAARRLTAGMHARDMAAFTVRLNAALGARAVLTEADQILDAALVAAHHDPEGGHL
ncbi:hypothetical protein [Streptomyces sp. AS02]|uniref:hypothetical protein n=1 Tax=Streptomyces sp. AS02 TaxID=2938946 RepID=UPI0020219994|nr:hypothetical protein [Streptomyces sp. AS02]MCL8016942.1 hypothetical protein [Streptomyces sp. AS02]